ncbi:MAG: hypothetical protein U5L11_12785 [Arhodomonas sp.]|nr:hypothetical protein [Arhodomonas sp.]
MTQTHHLAAARPLHRRYPHGRAGGDRHGRGAASAGGGYLGEDIRNGFRLAMDDAVAGTLGERRGGAASSWTTAGTRAIGAGGSPTRLIQSRRREDHDRASRVLQRGDGGGARRSAVGTGVICVQSPNARRQPAGRPRCAREKATSTWPGRNDNSPRGHGRVFVTDRGL